jgi:chromatin assembly factor 1 subunit B
MFAVVTMDTVAIYDTQQSTPLCLLTKLHYDEFTDLTWYVNLQTRVIIANVVLHSSNRAPDGQCLILSSRDGYCTLVVFDDILPAHHTQQHTLQLQSIAHHHSVPLSFPSNHHHQSSISSHATPAVTPSSANINLPFVATPLSHPVNTKKRNDPPLTPAASVDGSDAAHFSSPAVQIPELTAQGVTALAERASGASDRDKVQEPPKKKRRVALVHHVSEPES